MFYSAQTGGFYRVDIHGTAIPLGAVELSDAEHATLLRGQAEGRMIVADASGRPQLADRPGGSPEELLVDGVARAVQAHLDAAARALRYDSIASAVSYAEEPAVPQYQAEGRAFRAWRSLVWARCYELLAEVRAGTRAPMTPEAVIGELPALQLGP